MPGLRWLRAVDSRSAPRAGRPRRAMSCSSQSPLAAQVEAVERMVGDVELHHALAERSSRSVWVRTTMPSATGVVQEAGVPRRPSISTRQSRQEPNASSMSVAQSFGISMPVSIAARMIEVPSGTVTGLPSMVSVTVFSASTRGRAVVDFATIEVTSTASSPIRRLQARRRAEIFGEMRERAHHRIRREPAERAQRTELHRIAEIFEQRDVGARGPRRAMIRSITSTPRVEPMRQGVHLPQHLDRAELHREARLLGHVDGVVEHDDAAMADQAVARGEGLVVERRVEQRAREIGAERPADLHRAHRAAAARAAADVVDQLAERDAERASRTGRRA